MLYTLKFNVYIIDLIIQQLLKDSIIDSCNFIYFLVSFFKVSVINQSFIVVPSLSTFMNL